MLEVCLNLNGITASGVKNLLESNAVSLKKRSSELLPEQELSQITTDGTFPGKTVYSDIAVVVKKPAQ